MIMHKNAEIDFADFDFIQNLHDEIFFWHAESNVVKKTQKRIIKL